MPAIGLLGFGVKAGTVIIGTAGVRGALQKGRVVLVIVPDNPSERTKDKVVRLAEAKGIPVVRAPSAAALGAAVGADEVQAVAVRDRDLANGICAG